MLIIKDWLIVRFKPLLAHVAIVATIITLHPDLLKRDVKSIIILICLIIIGANNAAVSTYKERQ